MTPQEAAADYFDMLSIRYEAFRAEAQAKREAGQGDYLATIDFYTPIGELIRVGEMHLHEDTGTLQIIGDDMYQNARDVYTSPQNALLVFKIIPEAAGRKQEVGFTSKPRSN